MPAIETLTEKERDALRLLLAGHDAKSSARELNISYHTVNDRLRSARRKLEVGSSREAALLLAEAERETPKPVVHKPLGSADREAASDVQSEPEERGNALSPGMKKGLIIMTITVALLAGTLAMTNIAGQTGTAHPVSEVASTNAQSADAAREFLNRIYEGDAEGTYADASQEFRNAYSFNLWEFGVLLNRAAAGVQTRSLVKYDVEPGPRGRQVEVLVFDTILLNGRRKKERVVMIQEDAIWKVADIRITDAEDEG